jgi:hypothetical protein
VIAPDRDILEVEQRLAQRRAHVSQQAREVGSRATRALASPLALAAVAALGFVAAGALARRNRQPPHPERRKSDHLKAAKRTGIASMLLPAAMWLVRAQWGSPVRAVQALLENLSKRKPGLSPPGDMTRP